jgi:regulatory protein YycI of two-component signal transduction system YycFG
MRALIYGDVYIEFFEDEATNPQILEWVNKQIDAGKDWAMSNLPDTKVSVHLQEPYNAKAVLSYTDRDVIIITGEADRLVMHIIPIKPVKL